MTNFARLFPTPALLTSLASRCRVPAAVFTAVASAALMFAVSPAGALVSTVSGTKVGLQPRNGEYVLDGELGAKFENPEGNPVLHGAGTYVIYWDPTDHFHGDWQEVIDKYFERAGSLNGATESVFAVDSQYTDKSNAPASFGANSYRGSYTDTEPYPTSGCEDPSPPEPADRIGAEVANKHTPVCLTNAQVTVALEKAIAEHGLPRGMNSDFYILTPPGVAICLDGGGVTGHCSDYQGEKEGESLSAESHSNSFCSYHAAVNPGGSPEGSSNTLVYAVIPWNAGGYGDGHLLPADQTPGWECQDGGFNPASKPIEQREKVKVRDTKEENEFAEKNYEEKEQQEAIELIQGPHAQEPNQVSCPSDDGTCDTGLADLVITQIGSEQQNMLTDPLLNAWQDPSHLELTDECRNFFAPTLGGSADALEKTIAGTLFNQQFGEGSYYLNDAFNLAAYRLSYPAVPCIPGINLVPQFTPPDPVASGTVVGFDGMESDITLNAAIGYSSTGTPQANYATYSWNFGDGTPVVTGFAPGAPACDSPWLSPCAASIYHTYQYGGTYEVTLTVTDVGGNVASVTHPVTVVGPPPPEPPSSGSPGSGSGQQGSGATTTGQGATTQGGGSSTVSGGSSKGTVSVPAPVAAASIVAQSLQSVVHKGLVVRYSVNEQVAGHFEVLLSSAVAHRLGISGTPATGLPAGSPAEMVIAKAILVTTKGGHSAVHIEFSKRTAARLSARTRSR